MKLLIVIVNYRAAGLTVDALRSLEPEVLAMGGPGSVGVVVVDGASGDDSAQVIGQAITDHGWGDWAVLEACNENLGFAGGNNRGIQLGREKFGDSPYTLLLNPDTVVRPGGVRTLVEFMDGHPKVGLAGSRLEDPDGTPQRSAFRFPGVWSELERGARLGPVSKLLASKIVAPPFRDEPHDIDWVAGASLIVRQAVFDDVGLMDDGYFLYYEETDFCLKARRAGWPCVYRPESRVVHLVGQSTGVTTPGPKAKPLPAYWYASRARYFRKNHGLLTLWLANLAWLAGHTLHRLRGALTRRPNQDPPQLVSGFIKHSFHG